MPYRIPNYHASNLAEPGSNPIIQAEPGAERKSIIKDAEHSSPAPVDAAKNLTPRARDRLMKLSASVDSLKSIDVAGHAAREAARQKASERLGHLQSIEQREGGNYPGEVDQARYAAEVAAKARDDLLSAGADTRRTMHNLIKVHGTAFRFARSARAADMTDYQRGKGKQSPAEIRERMSAITAGIKQLDSAPESLAAAQKRIGAELDRLRDAGTPNVFLNQRYVRRGGNREDWVRQIVEVEFPTTMPPGKFRPEGDRELVEVPHITAMMAYIGGDALRSAVLRDVARVYENIAFSIDRPDAIKKIAGLRAELMTLELEACEIAWSTFADYPDLSPTASGAAILGLVG